ncbi:MAG: phospho-N-acetylmuramoyl-pentapeptide-transferase [Spirochaetota bacterium]|nr:phospho-N-acetylmuramoyl-pentapeptide-transferase [Spirochaetota bacterium]
MLFHWLSEDINLFRYLTFRNIGAALTAFIFVLWIGPFVINKLKEMRFGQQIRNEGPSSHLVKTGTPTMGGILIWIVAIVSTLLWASWNSFVLITCLSVILFGIIGFIDDYAKIKQKNTKGLSTKGKFLLQSIFAFIILILIYFIPQYHQKSEKIRLEIVDRYSELVASTNVVLTQDWEWAVSYPSSIEKGYYTLIGRQYNPETGKNRNEKYFEIPSLINSKIDKQIFSSRIVQDDGFKVISDIIKNSTDKENIVYKESHKSVTNIYKARLFSAFFVPMYTEVVWYWPLGVVFLFFIFIIVGVSNATNLSDGLDGLATGMGISFYMPFGVFAYLMGNAVLSSYLFYPYIEGAGELTIFIAASIGAFAGFLWYNVHPAEIFMGDTGSLPMGAAIATVAIMLKQEMLLVVAGFMFVLETVSVILQVFCFKKFKKRIFKMAPIHHHFELIGWKENQVVVRFWIMGTFCAMLALATIKIR